MKYLHLRRRTKPAKAIAVAYKGDPAYSMHMRLVVKNPSPIIRHVVAGRQIYILTLDPNGLWRDAYGVVWALESTHASLDLNQVCGVFPFSLPKWHIFRQLNESCARHDYMYSAPAYQYFNTREDADDYLEMLLGQDQYMSWLAKPFGWLSRLFGGRFWENKKTR